MIKIKLTVIAFSLSMVGNVYSGGVQDFFDSINGGVNVNDSKSYSGHGQNYYMGGSLYMRTPDKRYQLASATAPSVRASCSGIDAYMGSFSFINSDQLIQMGKNILANLPGAFFRMSLKGMCPPCDDIMVGMQDMANAMNRASISSCEAADGIITAGKDAIYDKENYKNTALAAMMTGTSQDFKSGWDKMSQGLSGFLSGKSSEVAAQKNNSIKNGGNDDRLMSLSPTGNVTWKALNSINLVDMYSQTGSTLSAKDNRLIMSFIGAYIFPKSGDDGSNPLPVAKPPSGIKFEDIVGNSSATTSKSVVYKCVDGDSDIEGCTNLTAGFEDVETFYPRVSNILSSVTSKIRAKTGVWTDQERAVFLIADFPLLPLLRQATSLPQSAGDLLISRYTELLAAKLAAAYLSESTRGVFKGIEYVKKKYPGNATDIGLDSTVAAAKDFLRDIDSKINQINGNMQSTTSIVKEIVELDAQLHAGLSRRLRNNAAFSGKKGG